MAISPGILFPFGMLSAYSSKAEQTLTTVANFVIVETREVIAYFLFGNIYSELKRSSLVDFRFLTGRIRVRLP